MKQSNTPIVKETYPKSRISISLALREALSGFKGWWLPLCLVSAGIMLSQSWLPRMILKMFSDVKVLSLYLKTFESFKQNILSVTRANIAFTQLKQSIVKLSSNPNINYQVHIALIKLMGIFFILFLFLAALYIVTIIISKNSIQEAEGKETHIKRDLSRMPVLSLSYLSLGVIQSIPFVVSLGLPITYILLSLHYSSGIQSSMSSIFYIAEFLILSFVTICSLLLSLYIFIRLYFTGFIITEETANPFHAIATSWKMTENEFSKLSIIFVFTIIIDIISIVTVIGFVPGTGLKYTLRASAYEQCLGAKYTQEYSKSVFH